jgi:RNA polymerase sigma-70 factor (ECF subfamily)
VLVHHAAEGNEGAFETLVRLHQDRAFLSALRLLGNRSDAQDAVQEAFLQAWRSLPRFRGESSFGTWFTRILINTCHNLRRQTPAASVPLEGATCGAVPGADEVGELNLRRDSVREAVLALPFDQRAPLVLHTFAGYSHAEIGRVLGISENAAKVRVHRARRALVESLREWK